MSRPTLEKVCVWCGNKFLARIDQIKLGRNNYCSRACNGAYGRYMRKLKNDEQPTMSGRRLIYYQVIRALKYGIIKKQPCETCGATYSIHAHHDDYSQPLNVRWLCNSCHKRLHDNLRARARHLKTAGPVMLPGPSC